MASWVRGMETEFCFPGTFENLAIAQYLFQSPAAHQTPR